MSKKLQNSPEVLRSQPFSFSPSPDSDIWNILDAELFVKFLLSSLIFFVFKQA